MNRSWTWPVSLTLGLLLTITWVLWDTMVSPAREVQIPRFGKARATPADFPFMGNNSCSGRACHGSLSPQPGPGIQQNEYHSWTMHDLHGQAYEILKSDRANRMAENLAPTNAEGKPIPATQDIRCLSCHTTPDLARDIPNEHLAMRNDGVSCEACHGPAKKGWLSQHTVAGWKDLTAEAKKETGYVDLSDLRTQAQVCVGCHIGAPGDVNPGMPLRDVNHDLMAAGHPRLTFELFAFRANMPPHWRATKYQADEGYAARSWAVGQVASAEAFLNLVAARSQKKQRWPEFANSSCYACHADLKEQDKGEAVWRSWRRSEKYLGQRKIGSLPTDRWTTTMLPFLEPLSSPEGSKFEEVLKPLYAELSQPYPDREKTEMQARQAARVLQSAMDKVTKAPCNASTVDQLLAGLVSRKDYWLAEERTWDEVEQLSLAIAALRPRQAQAPLGILFKKLAFSTGYESPQQFRSTKAFDQEFKQALRDLFQQLGR